MMASFLEKAEDLYRYTEAVGNLFLLVVNFWEVVIIIYALYLLICIAFIVTRPAKWSSFLE